MFSRIPGQPVTLELDDVEVEILRNLVEQLVVLLHDPDEESHSDPLAKLVGLDGPTSISDDPVLARLFPDAYLDDSTSSADFRRFTQPDLRRTKELHANQVQIHLTSFPGTHEVIDDLLQSWLLTLNDLRLALGTRLGLDNETEAQLEDESLTPIFGLYDWLTGLQGTLVEVLQV